MSKKVWRVLLRLLPILAYCVVVIVAFGPALFPKEGQILFAPDVWRYHFYQKSYLWTQLLNGHIPLWNPYVFSGQPFLEHPQVTVWYPLNLLYAILPISFAISWSLAIHILIALLGMYWVARKFVNPLPAWIAGLAFGLSGYYFGRIYAGHLEIIAASAWLPWVIGSFIDLIKSSSVFYVVRASLLLSLQLLAGHAPVALYTLESIGLLAIFKSIEKKSLRPILVPLGAILLGLAIAAVQLIPSQQFLSQSIRTLPLPDDWASIAVPTLNNLIELLDPHMFYNVLPKIPLGHEYAGYIGKLPLLFLLVAILFGLKQKSKKTELWWLVSLCIISLWVTLGNNAPIDIFSILRQYVPFYKELRIPSRHIILFVFAASLLAAHGIAKIKNKKVQICIGLLVLVDLVPFFRHDVRLGDTPSIREDKDLVKFLQTDTSLFRFLPDYYHADLVRDNFEFDAPMQYGIYSVSGYDQPPIRNYFEFLMAIHKVRMADIVPYVETTPPFQNVTPYLNFLNIKYIFIPIGNDPPLSDIFNNFVLVIEKPERGYRLYENKAALPRFYMVSNAIIYKDNEDLLASLGQGNIDPTHTVLLNTSQHEAKTQCGSVDLKHVEVISYELNSIVLATSNLCDGYLVSSEVNYPGWIATIDGKTTPLLTGNGAFRTLFVPKGNHQIIFQYVPKIYFISFIVSLILLSGSLLVLLKTAPRKT